MNDNINMNSTIARSMNDNINMNSTIARSMNDNINMDSTIARSHIYTSDCLSRPELLSEFSVSHGVPYLEVPMKKIVN
jgi:hypothetical protein